MTVEVSVGCQAGSINGSYLKHMLWVAADTLGWSHLGNG
jgi:hypothetical protein